MAKNLAGQRKIAVFTLQDNHYALDLSQVERVVRAVEITPLPEAPDIVMGIINLEGRVIPVLNIRKRFRLPERELDLSDHIIIAKTAKRPVALPVDEVWGIAAYAPDQIVPPGEIVPELKYVEGLVKTAEGMILIHDLNVFLSLNEEGAIDAAIAAAQS